MTQQCLYSLKKGVIVQRAAAPETQHHSGAACELVWRWSP